MLPIAAMCSLHCFIAANLMASTLGRDALAIPPEIRAVRATQNMSEV
jgi:hypothetical protein